ncbi:MAG: nucleotidyltransferase domain-containing protein [Candidatus Sericytochromatia bacterium]|nr:nucleotidyltransferase domain-containing protein [Candidatus Tanganyikabacteria bacterium]
MALESGRPRLGHVNQYDYLPVIVERLVREFDPIRIILFGSLARRDGGPWSDADLLVVMPEGSDRRRLAAAMHRSLADLPVSKDIFVVYPSTIERFRDFVGHIVRDAIREGQVLHDRG